MAISASSLTQILSPLHLNINTNIASSSPNLPFIKISSKSTTKVKHHSSLILFSAKSKNEMAIKQKRELLESYGLDPNKYLSEPSTKPKRRRGTEKNGSNEQGLIEAPKVPRTTHKLLQVLGGKARRMKLLSPKGMNVRPMMEVVKGAAFDILQVAGGCPASLRAGRWLDLYSGTGSVGIEAISRGCAEVHFVEMDPWVISNVLQPNLEWTGFVDDSVIHAVRVEIFFERAEKLLGNVEPFDYISVTPPYMEVDYGVLMGQISKSSLVGENTFIVVEYPLGTDMLDTCGCLVKIAVRRFGRTILAIYGPQWSQKKRKPKKRSIETVSEEKLMPFICDANILSC